jgi:hypothetical protein
MLAKTPRQYTKTRKTYKDVLTPTQVVEMERFLIALSNAGRKCKQAGIKPNISAAIWSWGNVPMTAGERDITDGFRKREKKAKIQRKGQAK